MKTVHGNQDAIMNSINSDEPDIVKVIKIRRLRWLGQLLECGSRTLAVYIYQRVLDE
jgi:hypothetical protein